MKISTINSQANHKIRHFLNMVKTSYIIHFFKRNTKQKSTLIIVVVGVVDCHHLQPMSIVGGRIGTIPLLRVAVRRQPADVALLQLHSGCSRSLLISWWPAVVRDVASGSDAVVRVRAASCCLSTTRRAGALQATAP